MLLPTILFFCNPGNLTLPGCGLLSAALISDTNLNIGLRKVESVLVHTLQSTDSSCVMQLDNTR